MSDRDKQAKHDRESNISSSLFARVNVGQNQSSNKFDSAKPVHTGGSMNNPDEQTPTDPAAASVSQTLLGAVLSALFAFLVFSIFRDYFYGAGRDEVLPSILLLTGSLLAGFSVSKALLRRLKKKKQPQK